MGCIDLPQASVVSPAPTRIDPVHARYAAPVYRGDPATTITLPKVPLCASAGRSGKRSCAQRRVSTSVSPLSLPSHGGIPISTTSTRPAILDPGKTCSPTLLNPRATVPSAAAATESVAPVSASTPVGTSTASSFGGKRRPRASRSASNTPDSGASITRPRPVPSSASITSSAPPRASPSRFLASASPSTIIGIPTSWEALKTSSSASRPFSR